MDERLDMALQMPPKGSTSRSNYSDYNAVPSSPLRVITRRLAQSFRAEHSKRPTGEALLIHALSLDVGIGGIASTAMKSASALSKLKTKIKIAKALQPIRFYGAFVIMFITATFVLAALAGAQYTLQGLAVPALLWLGLSMSMAASLLALTVAIILQANALSRIEQKRIYYHSLIASRGEKLLAAPTLVIERRGRKAAAMGTQYRNVRTH